MKKKLRISYTLLNTWRAGRIDDALVMYFKLAQMTSPAMEAGKNFDNYTNDFVRKNKSLPPELGGDKLIAPLAQEKWEIDLDERFELVGVPDIVDSPTLYEIKTGNSKDSGDYANDFQVGMYLLLAEKLGKKIDKAVILHYDQYKKELDKSLIWNTEYERNRAYNFITSLAPDIYEYFDQNNIWDFPNREIKGIDI